MRINEDAATKIATETRPVSPYFKIVCGRTLLPPSSPRQNAQGYRAYSLIYTCRYWRVQDSVRYVLEAVLDRQRLRNKFRGNQLRTGSVRPSPPTQCERIRFDRGSVQHKTWRTSHVVLCKRTLAFSPLAGAVDG